MLLATKTNHETQHVNYPYTVSNQASVFVNVNPPAGMIALPSCLKGFRQTGVDVAHVARNEGTKANPYIH